LKNFEESRLFAYRRTFFIAGVKWSTGILMRSESRKIPCQAFNEARTMKTASVYRHLRMEPESAGFELTGVLFDTQAITTATQNSGGNSTTINFVSEK
jgi:hypothetical protein